MKTSIYLDNAATTKTAQEVVDAMLPYFTENYGNPSSIYDLGTKSKEAITKGREQIAEVLGAKSEEIYFTAGGSEADNWALKATFEAYKNKGNHIITTKIEHHAILHTCEYLEKRGAKITYLDVDENGVVDLDQLQKAITPETILISVMFANNEIGTIQPIKEIGMIAKEHNILFHTDAVQAFGQVPINVDELNTFQYKLIDKSLMGSTSLYVNLMQNHNIYENIKQYIKNEDFDYVPAFKSPLVSLGLNINVYIDLIKQAKESTSYDFIIVDTNSVFDETKTQLLEISDSVIVLTTKNKNTLLATNDLVSHINGVTSGKYLFINNKAEEHALTNREQLRFSINQSIEFINNCDDLTCRSLGKQKDIQNIAYLLI